MQSRGARAAAHLRYFDGQPLYPFGFGRSYTTFDYQNARVTTPRIASTNTVTVSVDVTNNGGIASDEVLQLYLTHVGVAGAPRRTLQGFRRIHRRPGERKAVDFTLRDRAVSVVDAQGQRTIVPAKIEAWVGGGQPDARAAKASPGVQTAFEVTDAATPAEWNPSGLSRVP